MGENDSTAGAGPVPELEPFIEASSPKLSRSSSTTDLRSASKDLVLRSHMYVNDRKRELSNVLEGARGGSSSDKGKGRMDGNDLRHRLFLVGF